MSRRALIIGAGGLGTPAALALAASGRVRHVTLLDPDRVELTNLHRQILYAEADLGRPKAVALAEALERRFPAVEVEPITDAFRAGTVELLPRFDVVLDGTDRFETKLAISDACVDRGLPYVFAGVVGFDAQVLAVRPGESACLRCLFDEAPPPGAAATCADLGILGPVAGIAGAEQARAAAALLDAQTDVLDRLWVYDGLRDRSRAVPLRRARDCKGCGARRATRGLLDPETPALAAGTAPELDLSALVCPNTYQETRKALEPLAPGARLWVLLSSDESARNVPASAVASGHKVLASSSDGRVHRVLIERGRTKEV